MDAVSYPCANESASRLVSLVTFHPVPTVVGYYVGNESKPYTCPEDHVPIVMDMLYETGPKCSGQVYGSRLRWGYGHGLPSLFGSSDCCDPHPSYRSSPLPF